VGAQVELCYMGVPISHIDGEGDLMLPLPNYFGHLLSFYILLLFIIR